MISKLKKHWVVPSVFGMSLVAAIITVVSGNRPLAIALGLTTVLLLYLCLLVVYEDRHLKTMLVIPSIVLLTLISIVPIAYLVYLSFQNITMLNFRQGGDFVGIRNYINLLTRDPLFWPSLIRTLQYVLVTLALQFVLGLGLAILLNRDFFGRNVINTVLLLPIMTTPIVVATLWKYLLNLYTGGINILLGRLFGIAPIPWLTNNPLPIIDKIPVIGPWLAEYLNMNYAFLSIVLVNVWQWTPFVFLLLYAGLRSLPEDVFEAATVDGASGWNVFWRITLPMLKPVITVVVLVRIVDLMKVYDQIWALFGNATFIRTLNIHIYTVGLMNQNYGVGAALSIIVLILSLLLSLIFLWTFMRREKSA